MSVLFYPESIRILGSDASGNNVLLCEMAVDDIANLPTENAFISDGYVLSMGCVATAINDNSKHRLNGSGNWIQIAAGTSTYTRAEIDNLLSAITPAAVKAVDEGAKNLMTVDSGTGTSTWAPDVEVDIPAGTYVISFQSLASTDTDANICQIALWSTYPASGSVTKWVNLLRGSNVHKEFTIDSTIKAVRIYPSDSLAHGSGDTVTYSGAMICTAADWAVSQKFVPYAPTNRQLYEMILQLQGG